MIRKIPTLAAFALVVIGGSIGCSRSAKVQRGQQQYDVVQEGSTSGVTSTINGPGETTPPITNTNADTTTNFTIPTNPNPLGNDTAGTAISASAPSAPIATTAMTSTASPRPLRPRLYTPPPQPQELRPSTDTAMITTDTETTTAETTTTSPKTTTSPNPKKKSDEDQSPPPPTDTTGTRG